MGKLGNLNNSSDYLTTGQCLRSFTATLTPICADFLKYASLNETIDVLTGTFAVPVGAGGDVVVVVLHGRDARHRQQRRRCDDDHQKMNLELLHLVFSSSEKKGRKCKLPSRPSYDCNQQRLKHSGIALRCGTHLVLDKCWI